MKVEEEDQIPEPPALETFSNGEKKKKKRRKEKTKGSDPVPEDQPPAAKISKTDSHD